MRLKNRICFTGIRNELFDRQEINHLSLPTSRVTLLKLAIGSSPHHLDSNLDVNCSKSQGICFQDCGLPQWDLYLIVILALCSTECASCTLAQAYLGFKLMGISGNFIVRHVTLRPDTKSRDTFQWALPAL